MPPNLFKLSPSTAIGAGQSNIGGKGAGMQHRTKGGQTRSTVILYRTEGGQTRSMVMLYRTEGGQTRSAVMLHRTKGGQTRSAVMLRSETGCQTLYAGCITELQGASPLSPYKNLNCLIIGIK